MKKRKNEKPKELTRAELEVMQVIWQLKEAFLGEIVDQFPEPRPAYTTISTVIHTLEGKGFVSHHVVGKSHRYFPLITKENYRASFMDRVMHNFFNNSPGQVVSYFAHSGKLTVEQYEELKKVAQEIVQKP